MTLFFLFGLFAVLVISFIAVCVCLVLVGVFATVHRYMIAPIMRARSPWRYLPEEIASPAPVVRGPDDVIRYRRLLEMFASTHAKLVERRRQLRTCRELLRKWSDECDRIKPLIPEEIRGTTAELGHPGFAHAVHEAARFGFWESALAHDCDELFCEVWFMLEDRREYERDHEFMKLLSASSGLRAVA